MFGEKDARVKNGDQVDTFEFVWFMGHHPSVRRDMMSRFPLPWQSIFSAVSTTAEVLTTARLGNLKSQIQMSLIIRIIIRNLYSAKTINNIQKRFT